MTLPVIQAEVHGTPALAEPGDVRLLARGGDEVVLGSRGGKDLARYFPEMVSAVLAELPERCVVDGELVVPGEVDGRTRLNWEALSERIHPAASRVAKLSEETPSQFIAFDLLALGDRDLTSEAFRQRRALLRLCGGDGGWNRGWGR